MKLKKRFITLIVFGIIVLIIMGAATVLRAVFLNQVTKKINKSFAYQSMRLTVLPPALILRDIRSKSPSPFFSAKKLSVTISLRGLFSQKKPLKAVMEHPVFRVYSLSRGPETKKSEWSSDLLRSLEYGLIRDGEFYYWGKDIRFQAKSVNALMIQNKGRFSFKAESQENLLSIDPELPPVSGRISLVLEGRGEEINVHRIRLCEGNNYLNAKGTVADILNPEFRLETSYKFQIPMVAALLKLPFEWEGKAEGRGILSRESGMVKFNGDFSSDRLVLNKTLIDRIEGNVDYDKSARSQVDLKIKRASGPLEYGQIMFQDDRVWGAARGFHVDPIMKFIQVPWPVSSPVWGTFSLQKGKLVVDAEFRDDTEDWTGGRFPFQGKAHLTRDERRKELVFSSDRILSSFSDIRVDGRMVEGKSIDMTIDGKVRDIHQARIFTSRILNKNFEFPEIRGQGEANIRIFGDYWHPQVMSRVSLSPAGFDKLNAAHIDGEAEIIGGDFFGRFQIADPSYKGRVDVIANQTEVRTEIRLEKGFVEEILPALNIDLPIKGEGAGRFDYREEKGKIHFKSNFTAENMTLAGLPVTKIKVRLEGTEEILTLSDLGFGFYGGRVEGFLHLGHMDRTYDCSLHGEGIDLSFIDAKLKGRATLDLEGRGQLDQDKAKGTYSIQDLALGPLHNADAAGEYQLGLSEERIELKLHGLFRPGNNDLNCTFSIPLKKKPVTGKVQGSFTNLDLLVPWKGAKGRLDYRADIKFPGESPAVNGVIGLEGSVFPFPRFPHAIRDYAGLIIMEDGELSIRNFKGKLGGGDILGSGRIRIGAGNVEEIDISAEGVNLELSLLERTKTLGEGRLRLKKDADQFVLSGDFELRKISWRREIEEKLVFSSGPYYITDKEPGFFNDLTLNIRLKADEDVWMENSLGRFRGRFDLTISGNISSPILLGDIEVLEGDVYFQDKRFKILRGRMSFFNPLIIEPYLSFQGETYIKDYRVTFTLDGLLNNLNPELTSSPPLPPLDVLALLTLGESFRRTYHYDRSASQGTTSLLSFQFIEEAKKRAENMFNIDRFRIDPFILGSSAEMTARLTVGKKISRNIFVLYSTNLASQREEITKIEWEITKDLSIVGTRNEEGRVSIDVKIHKRF
jgi:hypothetical protein